MKIVWPELRRCCFCLPLRQGLLVFGYINLFSCLFLVSLVSSGIISPETKVFVFHIDIPLAVTVILYSLDIIFNIIFVSGIHTKQIKLIKIYYYFIMSTFITDFTFEVIELSNSPYMWQMSILFYLATFVVNVYLLCLVRSLMRKIEISESHSCNQLPQTVNGENNANSDQGKTTEKEVA